MTEPEFLKIATAVPANRILLEVLPQLRLPECYLTAGCLFQPVWNSRAGFPLDWGIKDFDVFYFDDSDLSWEAENEVIQRANQVLGALAPQVEIRNQARVHLWYEKRFGWPMAPLTSSRHGIDGFLIACTCVGVDVSSGALYAPDSLYDVWNGILRINPRNPKQDLFREKAQAYKSRWPLLTIDDEQTS